MTPLDTSDSIVIVVNNFHNSGSHPTRNPSRGQSVNTTKLYKG